MLLIWYNIEYNSWYCRFLYLTPQSMISIVILSVLPSCVSVWIQIQDGQNHMGASLHFAASCLMRQTVINWQILYSRLISNYVYKPRFAVFGLFCGWSLSSTLNSAPLAFSRTFSLDALFSDFLNATVMYQHIKITDNIASAAVLIFCIALFLENRFCWQYHTIRYNNTLQNFKVRL